MTAMRILLVEDHEDSANSLARILSKQGHVISIAGTLQEARGAAENQPFDLAICDLGLPDGDGSELMKEFSMKYQFPGIALTGFGMPEDIDRGKNAGFSAIVVKPVAFDQLLAVVEKVMGKNLQDGNGAADCSR
jgi:DNA-binding response OmpR family regulator